METVTTIAELRNRLASSWDTGKSVGLVPTMGSLHAGHLSLVNRSTEECDTTVVSLFVNPTQFNNADDLRSYPRNLDADVKLLANETKADILFAPTEAEVYPTPDTRTFDLGPVAEVMEGAHRPGHFNGVCQVVSKLFAYAHPTRAYFGEKDFQQVAVVREMVARYDFQVEIVSCPIVREADGLALSSRNALLTPAHRRVAPIIHRCLAAAASNPVALSPADLIAQTTKEIEQESYGLLRVEYIDIVESKSLQSITEWAEGCEAIICIAAWAGSVRLIDNEPLRRRQKS